MKLQEMVLASGLEDNSAKELVTYFDSYFVQLEKWQEDALKLEVRDEQDKESIEIANKAWKNVKSLRIDVEKTRKKLKESSLKRGRLIDTIAKEFKTRIEPIETHLNKQANYIKIKEQERKAKLKQEREEMIRPFVDQIIWDLGEKTEEEFKEIFGTARLMKDLKEKEAQEKREQEKKEHEARQKMIEENRRLKAIEQENARLKKEKERKEREEKQREIKLAKEMEDIKREKARLEKEKEKMEETLKQEVEPDNEEFKQGRLIYSPTADRRKRDELLEHLYRAMNTQFTEKKYVEMHKKIKPIIEKLIERVEDEI